MSELDESRVEQSKYYIDEQLKERMLVHVIKNRKKYKNASSFIREAIKEKLDREEQK